MPTFQAPVLPKPVLIAGKIDAAAAATGLAATVEPTAAAAAPIGLADTAPPT
ncbi:hypothetical protein NIIDMKKI_56360 [Mycobacterium kansasii]|uniref:Uncharacterized protein n=1 Tax=Mycobacterium kansasii TaxID=1768 RepID=A0A7G1II04_MYCKA|nr:hypothetical protein NIIDMKKI_56360 [Mycobacterium kansasii]